MNLILIMLIILVGTAAVVIKAYDNDKDNDFFT